VEAVSSSHLSRTFINLLLTNSQYHGLGVQHSGI
jgi:hypothetical protein